MENLQNAKIVDLVQYTLSKQDLEKLPEEFAALIATLCYASNEIDEFAHLFLSIGKEPRDEHIRRRWKIQRQILLRAYSSKIYESIAGVSGFVSGLKRKDNLEVIAAIRERLKDIENLKDETGYEIARFIRDKSTNHFLPGMAQKFLPHMKDEASRSMYLHRSQGDSFFPLGEEVLFDSAFHYLSAEKGIDGARLFETWLDWAIKARNTVTETFDAIGVELVEKYFPEKFAIQRKPYVEPRFIGDRNSKPLSLIATEETVPPLY